MTRLRFLAAVNPPTPEFDELSDDTELTFVPLEAVWPGDRWDPSAHRRKRDVVIGYTRFKEGDVLVPKITPTFQAGRSVIARGLTEGVAAGTTELHVVRPMRGVSGRFLNYVFQSRLFLSGGEAAMVGVAGQKRVPNVWLADFWVDVDAGWRQRAIADFLDAETARIDALAEKKRRMLAVLQERWKAKLAEHLDPIGGLRLKHLLAAPLAYGVLVPSFSNDGVPMLRITDLRDGAVDLEAVARIPEGLSREYRRTIVGRGDLVVSVVGTLGRSIEIGERLAGSNLNRALARVQLRKDVPGSLVRHWFDSDLFTHQAQSATSGDSAQPTLGLGDMKNFLIGFPTDRNLWPQLAGELDSVESRIGRAVRSLREQSISLPSTARRSSPLRSRASSISRRRLYEAGRARVRGGNRGVAARPRVCEGRSAGVRSRGRA